ncbi:MAG: caspase domain-containing protein [Bacteroidia bacterium]
MIRFLSLSILLCTYFGSLMAQPLLNKKFGEDKGDKAEAIVQTTNGDYIMVGYTFPKGRDNADIWVIRMSKNGDKLWEYKPLKDGHDFVSDLILAKDGDIVVAGNVGVKGDSRNTKGWIAKLDATKGTLKWEKTFGTKGEIVRDVIQTSDGAFVFAGASATMTKGSYDLWVGKLFVNGDLMWEKKYGGTQDDRATSVVETKDRNILVGGYTMSFGNGMKDMALHKIELATGKEMWSKTYGSTLNDVLTGLLELPNGQIILCGNTQSDKTRGAGRTDGELILVDKAGTVIWDKLYGKSGDDSFESVIKSNDGSLVVAGSLADKGMWVQKINMQGEVVWQASTTNDLDEQANAISVTKEGGYIVAGVSKNGSAGESDAWVFTVTDKGAFKNEVPAVAVNPAKPTSDPKKPGTNDPKKPTKPSTNGTSVAGTPTKPAPAKPTPTKPDATKPNPNLTLEKGETIEDLMKPNLYILAVGVSDYNDPKYNLTFAHTDADSVAEMFATMKGKIFRKVQVKKLLNQDASLVNIKVAINELEQQATQKDMVLMFFSSHGALDSKGNLYILPYDFSPVSLFATGLNIKDITSGVNGTPCKKLIFLDACHSGESGNDLLEFASLKDASIDNIVKEVAEADPGISIMTSSTGKEYSYEKPSWGHGAFTKAILEALRGGADFNKDKTIGFAELNLYVSERVKELTKGKQHPYTPINIFGNIPLFVLP